MAAYAAAKARAEAEGRMASFKRREPTWTEWKLPVLRVPVMQANANVVVLEPSTDSTFDYWLRISTLDKGNPLRAPVKLAAYHKAALAGKTLNTSTTLSKRKGVWWLTLSFDEELPLQTEAAAPVRVGNRIVHKLSRHALLARFSTSVDASDTASGKPSDSHAQQTFRDPVATELLIIAIRAAYLLLAIAGESRQPAQQPSRGIPRQRIRRKRLRDLDIAVDICSRKLDRRWQETQLYSR